MPKVPRSAKYINSDGSWLLQSEKFEARRAQMSGKTRRKTAMSPVEIETPFVVDSHNQYYGT
jgi:hypothetical protein